MGKRSRGGREPASVRPVRAPWRPVVLVVALACLNYAVTSGFDFTLDDLEIVRDNPRLTSVRAIPRLYADDYWGHVAYADHGLYRPTTLATFAIGRAAHGPGPSGHHVVNVLLHAAASAGLGLLVLGLFGKARIAWPAAALFAVHPIHIEPVAGIVGRAEILAWLGTLAAIAASRRALAARGSRESGWWAAGAACCYMCAATSKESALVAPLVVALTEILAPAGRSGARRAALAAVFGAAALALVAVRGRAVDAWNVATTWRDLPDLERVMTAVRIFGEYVGLLLLPLRQSAEYGQLQIAAGPGEPGVLAGFAAAIGLVVLAWRCRRGHPALAWGLATFLAILAPVSNILFPVGVAKAERILYAPSAGFLVALAAAGAALTDAGAKRRAGAVLLAGALVASVLVTQRRIGAWRDNCSLAAATIVTAPDSPIFLVMHARCQLAADRPDEARATLARAFAVSPGFVTAHLVMGDVEEREGNLAAAVAHDEAVLAQEPRHLVALSRASVRLARLGRDREAAARYEQWRAADPADARPWAGLVKAYALSGDLARATAIAAEATARFPQDPLVQQNAAAVRAMQQPSP